ncbi:pyridoxamine 5'-phosphate oxidase family protein [Azospira restricta]|uniref:Pyridoxamine 5'-phosphate oxidase family protein n=1 Tax=Azospira restricta TaxID=404405 RepID=A0A974PYI8_9RHOO|nr:pyridoxamine 5'-phosphate oxidase family protein [Azospira restricta]QRJ63514.1 pyridoxamine 5'-phosphate oxidase family protein [Azospira restricta]
MTTEPTAPAPFHAGEIAAQQRWQTASLWDEARRRRLLWDHLPEAFHARIAAAPFFFLATSGADGRCDCSFKGGGPGLVRILDSRRFAFPDFDGNGAFMSLGNLLQNPQVGCLFIDFADGARLRVNGRARIHEDDAIAALFPACRRAVLVDIEQVVPNCPQHIPRLLPA